MDQTQQLLTLCNLLSGHLARSHWTISVRIFGKGDFFKGLLSGGGCTVRTATKAFQWFADNWPADLAWPREIPRPPKLKKEAA